MLTETLVAPQSTVNIAEIQRVFDLQKQHQYTMSATTARERIARLQKLHKAILAYRERLTEAIYADYRKPAAEVDISEIYPVVREIKTAINSIHQWMEAKAIETPLALIGSSSEVQAMPKGVVLIISPWNYPVNLTFYPLVSAIAAGNCVILKPSEMVPHTSAVMSALVREVFEEREVAIFEGDAATSTALLKLPFNHIFYTGSPNVGKVVMQAAALHLSSITLELGGKSPVIIDQTANIKDAINKVAAAKFINAGQTCIAPDYLLIHESVAQKFIEGLKANVAKNLGTDPQQSVSYARVVNIRHTRRIKNLLDEAVRMGANVVFGGNTDLEDNYIAPTVLTNIPDKAQIMTEEIFGPILPVLTFRTLDEAVKIIQSKPAPLSMYIFSSSRKSKKYLLANTQAGDVCINDCAVHFLNANLPFGGHNNSGIGKGHGEAGFRAFSHSRSVLRQQTIFNTFQVFYPPFTGLTRKLLNIVIKWL